MKTISLTSPKWLLSEVVRDKVKGKNAANRTHHEVGAKVRQTIKELGGTMPEDLPVVESVKKIESQIHKQIGDTNVVGEKE